MADDHEEKKLRCLSISLCGIGNGKCIKGSI